MTFITFRAFLYVTGINKCFVWKPRAATSILKGMGIALKFINSVFLYYFSDCLRFIYPLSHRGYEKGTGNWCLTLSISPELSGRTSSSHTTSFEFNSVQLPTRLLSLGPASKPITCPPESNWLMPWQTFSCLWHLPATHHTPTLSPEILQLQMFKHYLRYQTLTQEFSITKVQFLLIANLDLQNQSRITHLLPSQYEPS